MSRIRSNDTRPELLLRSALHAHGFRYRLHLKDMPGKPDLVFLSRRAVIFVHGCFWHGHENCRRFKPPETKLDYWQPKIRTNIERDLVSQGKLLDAGWRVLVVWECALVGRDRLPLRAVIEDCEEFLNTSVKFKSVRGG